MAMVRLLLLSALVRCIQLEAVHLFTEKRVCPDELCIDYGSSGAKFGNCKRTWTNKFLPGAGSFGKVTTMKPEQVLEVLTKYLAENAEPDGWEPAHKDDKPPIVAMGTNCKRTTKLIVCGGTAGNRFIELKNEDRAGWENFNAALNHFVTNSGPPCQTLPGTTEATVEFAVAKQKLLSEVKNQKFGSATFQDVYPTSMFVGIGGASMQLRLVTSKECPTLQDAQTAAANKKANKDLPPDQKLPTTVEIDGGVGASRRMDFCKKDGEGGQLWSFLADSAREQDGLHVVGGMDQVALVFYPYIKPTLRRMEGYTDLISDIQWVDTVITETIWRDPMWRKMLTVQHEQSCTDLIPNHQSDQAKYIVLLSNAQLGSSLIEKQFRYRTDREHFDAGLLQTSASSNETLDVSVGLYHGFAQLMEFAKVDPGFWAVSAAVREKCTKATEDYESTMQRAYWTKFKAYDEVPISKGFMCESLTFHLGWMLTLSGYIPYEQKNEACVKRNFQALCDAHRHKGDWMVGALLMGPEFYDALPRGVDYEDM